MDGMAVYSSGTGFSTQNLADGERSGERSGGVVLLSFTFLDVTIATITVASAVIANLVDNWLVLAGIAIASVVIAVGVFIVAACHCRDCDYY
jgi:hypothetical protein